MNPGARRAALGLESSQLTAPPLRNYMLSYQPLYLPCREGGRGGKGRGSKKAGAKDRQDLMEVWRGIGGEMEGEKWKWSKLGWREARTRN